MLRSLGEEERAHVAGLRGSLEHRGQDRGCCIYRQALSQNWEVELQCPDNNTEQGD